jgi:hypothetical protein
MGFEGKVKALTKRLQEEVLSKIDSVDEARELVAETLHTANSQVARMAELFYENQGRFGIERQVAQVLGHPNTKRSALREAITSVLRGYIQEQEDREDRELVQPQAVQPATVLA